MEISALREPTLGWGLTLHNKRGECPSLSDAAKCCREKSSRVRGIRGAGEGGIGILIRVSERASLSR